MYSLTQSSYIFNQSHYLCTHSPNHHTSSISHTTCVLTHPIIIPVYWLTQWSHLFADSASDNSNILAIKRRTRFNALYFRPYWHHVTLLPVADTCSIHRVWCLPENQSPSRVQRMILVGLIRVDNYTKNMAERYIALNVVLSRADLPLMLAWFLQVMTNRDDPAGI